MVQEPKSEKIWSLSTTATAMRPVSSSTVALQPPVLASLQDRLAVHPGNALELTLLADVGLFRSRIAPLRSKEYVALREAEGCESAGLGASSFLSGANGTVTVSAPLASAVLALERFSSTGMASADLMVFSQPLRNIDPILTGADRAAHDACSEELTAGETGLQQISHTHGVLIGLVFDRVCCRSMFGTVANVRFRVDAVKAPRSSRRRRPK